MNGGWSLCRSSPVFGVHHAIPETRRSRLAGDGLKRAALSQLTRVIVNDHRWQASSYSPFFGFTAQTRKPVGAGLLAMGSSAPR